MSDKTPSNSAERSPHLIESWRDGTVPSWLRTAAAFAWRVLVVAAALVGLAAFVSRFQVVVIPLLVAVMIAAVFAAPVRWLVRRGLPPLLATWIMIMVGLLVLVGSGWYLAPRLAVGFADLGAAVEEAYDGLKEWMVDGPLGLDRADIADTESRLADRARSLAQADLPSRAGLVVEVVTGLFLTLVIAFFYVKDGPEIRNGLVRLLPKRDRRRALRSFHRGLWVIQRYLLGVVVVGATDAIIIGIGLFVIGVPHVLPVMVLTFLAAFFPLVGAIFAGGVATLLALAAGGMTDALLVVGLTVLVQQVDGDVIAPVVYSRAVSLHPLAVLIALTVGAISAGVIGAFLAVPTLAVVVAVVTVWQEIGPSISAEPAR